MGNQYRNFDQIFDPSFWTQFDKRVSRTFEGIFRGIALKKSEGILTATLDIPGVAKEDIEVKFSELHAGFTRLSITTKRNGAETAYRQEFRETVDAAKAAAKVELGVLTVTVPLKKDDSKANVVVEVS